MHILQAGPEKLCERLEQIFQLQISNCSLRPEILHSVSSFPLLTAAPLCCHALCYQNLKSLAGSQRGECGCRGQIFWVPCCVRCLSWSSAQDSCCMSPLGLLVSDTGQSVRCGFPFYFLLFLFWKMFCSLCGNLTYVETVGSGLQLTLLYLINPGNSFPQHRIRPSI